jgi:hydrogenase-4 component B
MRAPMLALAAVCAAIGLAPQIVWPALSRAVSTWNPAWAAEPAPAPLRTLGVVHLALAILAVLASVWLWRTARENGLRRGLTWDCGYAAPTPRMQYTSGSFAGIAATWFVWILLPERRVRRPRGPFPVVASRIERVPETVLERVLSPAGSAVLQVSMAVRRLQHGRLQAYILYLVLGLAGLALLVLFGGRP